MRQEESGRGRRGSATEERLELFVAALSVRLVGNYTGAVCRPGGRCLLHLAVLAISRHGHPRSRRHSMSRPAVEQAVQPMLHDTPLDTQGRYGRARCIVDQYAGQSWRLRHADARDVSDLQPSPMIHVVKPHLRSQLWAWVLDLESRLLAIVARKNPGADCTGPASGIETNETALTRGCADAEADHSAGVHDVDPIAVNRLIQRDAHLPTRIDQLQGRSVVGDTEDPRVVPSAPTSSNRCACTTAGTSWAAEREIAMRSKLNVTIEPISPAANNGATVLACMTHSPIRIARFGARTGTCGRVLPRVRAGRQW